MVQQSYFETIIIYFKILVLCYYYNFSQVGIGTTSTHPPFILAIESTNQGILVPRLTTTQRNSTSNSANGLLVFNVTIDIFEFNLGSSSSPI